MIALRDRSWRRLGASLGGLALGLQLMLSGLGLAAGAAAPPADAFGGHALCLAGAAGEDQPAPAGGAPAAPSRPHLGLCCLWHQLAGVSPAAMPPAQPVRYARIAAPAPAGTRFLPRLRSGPANARAPPTLA
jgi:hypothetical protein